MAVSNGIRILHLQIGILLLGIMASPEQVGLFRIAGSTAIMIAVPIGLMVGVASPVLARLFAQGDLRRLQQVCTRSAQAMTAAVLLLFVPFLLWGSSLLTFVFGREYAPAQTALLLMGAGHLINAFFGLNAALLTMAGHERRVTRAMFIGLIVNLVLVVLLVPIWRGNGAAAALGISLVAWNIVAWMDAKRIVGIDTSIFARRGAR